MTDLTVLIVGGTLIVLTPFVVELYFNWKESIEDEVENKMKEQEQ